jgi:DNA-binding SARP family transcriptional activator
MPVPINSTLDRAVEAGRPVLHLFGGPAVTVDHRRVDVPEGSKRLLVFVALHRRHVERRYVAGSLWPAGGDSRAAGNLRSALWRLKVAGISLLRADKYTVALRENVVVDVQVVADWAARLIDESPTSDDLTVMPWAADALDVLPGWYEDWALVERERVRQRMLHALEALSRQLVRAGRCAEAVEVAMMAVSAEPLRESAQRTLIEAHLAEGNWIEGLRGFAVYRRLLRQELGTEPNPALSALVGRPAGRHHMGAARAQDRLVERRLVAAPLGS